MAPKMTGSSQAFDISKVRGATRHALADYVAIEEPLEIQLSSNSAKNAAAKSISITMRTPGHDVELVLGFLFSESIISHIDEVSEIGHTGQPDPDSGIRNIVRVDMRPNHEIDLDRLQRHFYTTSSCGVCGKASIDALRVAGAKSLASNKMTYSHEIVTALPYKLFEQQPTFAQTGGLHAAAAFDDQGSLVVVREDVGRHNAVDKVVGTLLQKTDLHAKNLGLLVSGRASFELVQKALVAGMATLIAVGAPSSLAVALADENGMTLIGFLRDSGFNIYAGQHRITDIN